MALAKQKKREDVRLAGGGRYELRGVVGGGRTGIVHRAYDRELGRTVALKTLRTFDADALYRIKREFRTLARLAHPNLVPFFDLFVEGDERFFTMELVDGVEFVDHVERGVIAQRTAFDTDGRGPLGEARVRAGEAAREFHRSLPSPVGRWRPRNRERIEDEEREADFDESSGVPVEGKARKNAK